MKKELKDYLHLYLGCNCIVDDIGGIHKIETVYANGYVEVDYNNIGTTEHAMFEVKPILRPLSDMTEEETITYEKMVENAKDYDMTKVIGWTDSFVCEISEQVLWLLSKHFDLFGLIEAGFAIDKTLM